MELFQLAYRHQQYDNVDENTLNIMGGVIVREVEKWKKNMHLHAHPTGILYANVHSKHAIEDLLINHYALMFPNFRIVLEGKEGSFVSDKGKTYFTQRSAKEVIAAFDQQVAHQEHHAIPAIA